MTGVVRVNGSILRRPVVKRKVEERTFSDKTAKEKAKKFLWRGRQQRDRGGSQRLASGTTSAFVRLTAGTTDEGMSPSASSARQRPGIMSTHDELNTLDSC